MTVAASRTKRHRFELGVRRHEVRWARALAVSALLWSVAAACGGSSSPGVALIEGADTENAISLRSTGNELIWVDRRAGRVLFRSERTERVDTLGAIPVSNEGEQRGLLGFVGAGSPATLYVSFTRPGDRRLVVTELTLGGKAGRVVWNGTTTDTKAIGGHLETRDGLLVLGLGELTGWGKQNGSGAIVTLDPQGPPDQEPVVLTDGWHNPFAFAVTRDGTIWVADNAPDGQRERIGRGDTVGTMAELPLPQRAPSGVAMMADGRVAVCGFLDGDVRAYRVAPDGDGNVSIERAGTVAKGCTTGVLVDDSGAMIVATQTGLARVVR